MNRIVLSASPVWLARLIRYMSSGRASHAMLQYSSELWGGEWIAEATIGGVQKRPAELRRHHVVHEFECLFDAREGLRGIRKLVGSHYDYEGLIFFGWVKLVWMLFHKKIRKPWHSTKGQFCSELIWRLFQNSNLPGTLEKDPEGITPEDILCYMESNPALFKRL